MSRYLVDTNVLLRGAANTSAHNPAASGAVARLLGEGEELFLVPQVLIEFWSVATRPVEVNGFGWPVDAVQLEIDRLLDQFPVLPETPALFAEWLRLVKRHGVIGKRVHDTRLVAFLSIHQVDQLLTFNTRDFEGYGIGVVSPAEVMAGESS
jgi:predicted nucleic acid-binding protein